MSTPAPETSDEQACDGQDCQAATTLEEAVRAEVTALWFDLDSCLRAGGDGSATYEDLTERLHQLEAFVGPPHWAYIPIELTWSGRFEALHHQWAIPVPVDWQQVRSFKSSEQARHAADH